MWAKNGSVSLTKGSNVVTGKGTTFSQLASVSDGFIAPDGEIYEIINIVSDTSLTIERPYKGASGGNLPYLIMPLRGGFNQATLEFQKILNEFGGILSAGLTIKPNASGVTADRKLFDFEQSGFTFLDVQAGKLYVKLTGAEGDWSKALTVGGGVKGDKGDPGEPGPMPPVAQELGDNPNWAVSQKLLKDSITSMEEANSTVVGEAQLAANAAKASETAASKSAAEAEASQTAAKTSETNAGKSATAAKTSETNAGKSETSAKASADSAKASETAASKSAAAAKTSETNSAASAASVIGIEEKVQALVPTIDEIGKLAQEAKDSKEVVLDAKTEATNAAAAAKASQNAAKASETAASKSAAEAEASQDAAKLSETNAAASADSVKGLEEEAEASAAAAKLSENNAAASAQAAKTSETAAKSSQTAAASSQKAAKTSETNSKASETAAGKSAAAAQLSETAAASSQEAAKLSETNAKASEDASKLSETNAKESEAAAKTSETNASESAAAAQLSQTESKSSQEAAKLSETNAGKSATAAKTSETNAGKSVTAAKTSETAAKDSQEAALKSQAAAKVSEDNANVSATAAKASETNAKESETAAKASQEAAKTSETAAKASQTAASKSATAAKTSETNAGESASAAKTSETNAGLSAQAAKGSEERAKTSELIAVEAESTAQIALEAAVKLEPEIKTNADKAETSATSAKSSEELAKKWASNPVNSPVQGGEYSAKHWAEIAKGNANGDAYLTKVDNLKSVADKAEARKNLGFSEDSAYDFIKGKLVIPYTPFPDEEEVDKREGGVVSDMTKDSAGGFVAMRYDRRVVPKVGGSQPHWIAQRIPSYSGASFGVMMYPQSGNSLDAYVPVYRRFFTQYNYIDHVLLTNLSHGHVHLGTTTEAARKALQLDPLFPMGGGKLSYKNHELANKQDVEGVDNKVALVNEGLQALEEDVVLEIERTNEGIQELATLLDQNASAIAENSQKIIGISAGELAANTASDLSDKKYLGTSYYVDHSTVVDILPQYISGVGSVVALIDTTKHSLHRIVTVTAVDKEIHVRLMLGEPNMSGSIYVSVLREHTLIWESNCIFLNDSMPEPKEDGTAQYLVSYLQIGPNVFINATEVKFG